MPDPQDLYQLADDVPDLGRPVLIQALTGFVDAGAAARLARDHLLTSLPGRIVATFDVDALLDYRSRRPVMLFVEDHWESYEEPSLALHLLHDGSNTPFLLLSGPEPDLYWERFTAAVMGLVDRSPSCRLVCQLYKDDPSRPMQEMEIATEPGTVVIFNGDKLWHAVTPLGDGEERAVLTLEYVTNPDMSPFKRLYSNLKDAFGYFGLKAFLRG